MDQSTSVIQRNGVPMTTTPHLLAEDRPDFERILDEALRAPEILAALAGAGPHLTAAQLRTKALLAADTAAAGAADEYLRYTGLRTALRHQEGARPRTRPEPEPAPAPAEQGVGLLPALTVLAPILSWSAAAVLLLLGYTLRATSPALALGRAVVTAGWTALAVGVATLVTGAVGLMLTALRDSTAPPPYAPPQTAAQPQAAAQPRAAAGAAPDGGTGGGAGGGTGGGRTDAPTPSDGLAEARLAWHTALLERALLPYLRANLSAEPALPAQPAAHPNPPELLSPGYSRAAFGSPGFTSPGAENLTGPEGRTPRTAEFSSPGYSPPGFTGPDEV
ncbi:hypothetical protein [Kitasatospora sp. NPDC001175]